MRMDIYRRAEHEGIFSYLAVPEGAPIPEEANNTDWVSEAHGIEIDDAAKTLPPYRIEQPLEQISAKGYAITGLKDMGA